MIGITEYNEKVMAACRGVDTGEYEQFLAVLDEAYRNDQRIFIFGNGGSGANASHFCEDLGKCTLTSLDQEKRFKVISLTDNTSYIMAWANDESYDVIFEQQLRSLAEPGDVAIGISGSGNSPNILLAIEWANGAGLKTVGLTGFGGGKLREMVHHPVHVPVNDMGVAESVHMILFHHVVAHFLEKLKAEA